MPLLSAAGVEVVDLTEAGLPETPDEDELECHATFEANALAKARYFRTLSGMSVMADDSGLEVEALGGRPGVRSKRWSERPDLEGQVLDDANNATLLSALAPGPNRRARFVCAAAAVNNDGEDVCRGETLGEILREPQGRGGFGYDPYFWSLELGCAFGEVTPEEKARVSHRARAFSALLSALAARR